MRPLSAKQFLFYTLVYLAAAVGGSVFLVGRGSPEMVPAALLAQAFGALFLFFWYRVDERVWRPHLWTSLALAAACVVTPAYFARKSPWAMTPAFLVHELPVAELVETMDARLQTKARLSGRVLWWDEYPFNRGLEDPVKVRIENKTGVADVILDRDALDRELEVGQEIRMLGRIRKWEGEVIRFVALEVTFVEPTALEGE